MLHTYYTAVGIRSDLAHLMADDDLERFIAWMENHPNVDLSGQDEDRLVQGWASLTSWTRQYANRPLLITNAFSLNMLPPGNVSVTVKEITVEDIRDLNGRRPLESAVGHPDTAAVFGSTLGLEVEFNRTTIKLTPGNDLLVGQYVGPRLAEGTVKLPPDARIEWKYVTIA